jgi:hypothetical protein
MERIISTVIILKVNTNKGDYEEELDLSDFENIDLLISELKTKYSEIADLITGESA